MEKTKAQKRVLIAKDVLLNLKASKFIAMTGNYCTFRSSKDTNEACFFKEGSLKKQLKAKQGKVYCEGCALGSAFQAYVMRFNNVNTYDGATYFDFPQMKILRKIFTKLQLGMIESAFECHDMTNSSTRTAIYSSIAFGQCSVRPNDRLVRIMKNIVKNKGTFRPTKVN